MGLIESNNRDLNSDLSQLKELVSQGHLDIKLILANPRTGSTLLETSFAQNQAISGHVHEPFHRSNNAPKGSAEPTRIVIKEISRGLTAENEHERFLSIVKSPPTLLVRNPLLSTESKIKMVLKGLSSWNSPALQEILHKFNDHGASTEKSQLILQNHLLERFSQSNGFKGWKSMLEESFRSQKYKPFSDILSDQRIFRTEPAATLQIMHYLESIGRPFLIVNNTDFRLDPHTVISGLCEQWSIPFSANMISWGKSGKKLHTGRTDVSAWFERVQNSTKIDPPYEIPPALDDFPDFIARHLINAELPAYFEMFTHASRVKPSVPSFQRQIEVPGVNNDHSVKRNIFDIDPIYFWLSTQNAGRNFKDFMTSLTKQ